MQNPPPYLKDRGFALNMAETKRFELLKGLTPYLVSSEAHSTGLCDVSELQRQFTGFGTVYYPPFRRENDLGRLDS